MQEEFRQVITPFLIHVWDVNVNKNVAFIQTTILGAVDGKNWARQ
jgi:hypothetical protein